MDEIAKPKSSAKAPPVLEQLGALGSLLVHDMANQMCIISGNATFAQMMLADPQQVSRAVDAIAKSSERMSFILGQVAELRRRLAGELPHGQGLEAAARLHELFLEQPDWNLEIPDQLDGELYVPTSWVVFAVEETLKAIRPGAGEARLRRARPEEDTAFLPGGSYFEVRLKWRSAERFSMDDIRQRYDQFGLLAAFELIRQCGGKLEGFTPAPGYQEVLLCVPFVYDVGSPAGAS